MGDTESTLPYSPVVPNSSDEEHSKARGVVETDFWGTAMMTLHAMRIMRENNARNGKQGGMVIQITSMGGYIAFPGNAFYHAAKFAVEGFTESVRREVRPEWNSKTISFCLPSSTDYMTNMQIIDDVDSPFYNSGTRWY